MSCKYKDILGKPNTVPHSIRLFNLAIVDILLTIVAAYLIHKFLLPKCNFFLVLLCLFLAGIIIHRMFCVRTTIDKILFPGQDPK
jgi:hypothetical protein